MQVMWKPDDSGDNHDDTGNDDNDGDAKALRQLKEGKLLTACR